ncbi:MAG TPA: hypothetical protein VIL16_18740 [Trebonia sp.]
MASPRVAYFLSVPFALASIVAFLRFDEPQLHWPSSILRCVRMSPRPSPP